MEKKRTMSLADLEVSASRQPKRWDLSTLGSPAASYFTGDDPAWREEQMRAKAWVNNLGAGKSLERMLSGMSRK